MKSNNTPKDMRWESFLGPPNHPDLSSAEEDDVEWVNINRGGSQSTFHLLRRGKRTILAGTTSLGSKNLRSPRRSRCARWEPGLAFLAWVRIRPDHNVGLGRLHNWTCNLCLRELPPEALLTPLRSCWVISKPRDWMIHSSPLGSWLSGADPEMRTKFIREDIL